MTSAFWTRNNRPIPIMPLEEEIRLFKSRARWRTYGIVVSVILFGLATLALCFARQVAIETKPVMGEPSVEVYRMDAEPVDSRIRL